MPYALWTEAMYRELEQIYSRQGHLPIVAHVDRYLGRFRTWGIPKRLSALPVLVQANASFFAQNGTASRAMHMLRKEQIHLLGSDCHDLNTRKPNLGIAVKKIQRHLGETPLERIMDYQTYVFG